MTDAPVALLAELTHRCPLRCAYCSNPTELVRRGAELSTETWGDVFAQAAALGALQVHLSGGEPAARGDLVELVGLAHRAGLYTNLITSGVGLGAHRLAELVDAGLDHVQLSVQSTRRSRAEAIGGLPGALQTKARVAREVVARDLPLTLNAVLHRANIDEVEALVALARDWGASRIELAHVQLMGWAWDNREALVPTWAEVRAAADAVRRARDAIAGRRLVIDYVCADTHADRPKACMGGWGAMFMVVAPDGAVLPCHGAAALPMPFARVPEVTLEQAWRSEPFARFRSTDALSDPCRSCDERHVDAGGCRCQAFLASGSLTATDPACDRARSHGELVALRLERSAPPARPRAFARAHPPSKLGARRSKRCSTSAASGASGSIER